MLPKVNDGEWVITLSEDSHPEQLMIELTTACNYDCVFCFRRVTNEKLNGFMEEQLYRKILDDAVKAGIKKISFTGWGETLVHPKALQFIEEAKGRGFNVLVATNGFFLDKYAEKLVSLETDELYVSVDSVEEELYSMLRVGGNLSNVTKGLLKIKKLKSEQGHLKPDVTLQVTVNNYNIKGLRALPDYGLSVHATKIVVSMMLPLTKEMEKSMACYMNKECVMEIEKMRDIAESLAPYITIILPNTTTATERKCPFVSRLAAFIRWDGKVAPCIYYAHSWKHVFEGIERKINAVIFGDLNKVSLLDVWRSPDYAAFRARAYFFRMPSCLDCPVRHFCALTLSNETDCWGNSPTCAACPFSHDMVRCPL